MRSLVLLIPLLLLASCTTYELGSKWSPLSKVVERPRLPFTNNTSTITVGSHLYVTDLDQWLEDYPPGSVEFEALMRHERVHARRQFGYMDLPGEVAVWAWIGRYLTDREFMWSEEQLGYYESITHLAAHRQWDTARTNRQATVISDHYKTLGGKRMISFAKARRWIEDVLAGRWKP